MRASRSLLLVSLVATSLTLAAGAPPGAVFGEARQAVFSQKPFLGISGDEFRDVAAEWLDDAKKAILHGKNDLEKWYHQGKEYIKQDNLLCTSLSQPSESKGN